MCSVQRGQCTKSHAAAAAPRPSIRSRHSPASTRKSSCGVLAVVHRARLARTQDADPEPELLEARALGPRTTCSGRELVAVEPPRIAGVHDEPALARGREPARRLRSRGASGTTVSRLVGDAEVASSSRAPAPPRLDERARAERELALLRGQGPHARRAARHHLRGSALPQHRRVLGARDGDVPDPRRHLHARVPVLLRPLGQARRAARIRWSRLRLAQAAHQMGLSHVVVTSVDRDDIPDRGAAHYAATIRALQRKLPGGDRRDPHARLPRGRGGGARDGPRRAARRLRPQHRDRPPAPRAHARRQGELRQGALAPAAGQGARRATTS